MEYQALYRKYRPKNFDEVSGQKITLKVLRNAIKMGKIAHAYLFYGPRGTGKTSIAKILARTINCENNDKQIPCEKCDSCKISLEKECVDIIEIDAASNNGVDEIRELKNKISFVPSELKYKVYIIDEVHMLSTGAFNALLKTLEEPPAHAIFILATTELNKVPTTIISRCQTLEFNKINNKSMNERLRNIADKENIKIDDQAINEISRCSNGGLRDAIGLLEKANSYNNEQIDVDVIKEISGNITEEELTEFLTDFENKNIKSLIKKIDDYYDEGIDLIKLINTIIEYLSDKIISEGIFEKKKCELVKELDNIVDNIRKSENPKILFEIVLLNLLVNDDNGNITKESVNNDEKININNLNKNTELSDNKDSNLNEKNISSMTNNENLKKIRVGNTLVDPKKNIISEIRQNWGNLKDLAFDKNYGNISRILSTDITPVAASNDYVILISKLNGISEQINNDLYTVENIFELLFNKKFKVICISEKEWNEYIELYKKDKNYFKYTEETQMTEKKEMTLKEKAKALFEDI